MLLNKKMLRNVIVLTCLLILTVAITVICTRIINSHPFVTFDIINQTGYKIKNASIECSDSTTIIKIQNIDLEQKVSRDISAPSGGIGCKISAILENGQVLPPIVNYWIPSTHTIVLNTE